MRDHKNASIVKRPMSSFVHEQLNRTRWWVNFLILKYRSTVLGISLAKPEQDRILDVVDNEQFIENQLFNSFIAKTSKFLYSPKTPRAESVVMSEGRQGCG